MNLQAANASHYDPSATVFPPAMPQAAVEQFPGYMGEYLRNVADAGGQVLGYAAQVPHGEDLVTTTVHCSRSLNRAR